MAVRIKCPNPECNATCRIRVSGLGRRLRCGRCGRRFAVSDASPEPTRPVAPPGKGDAQRPASLPGAPHPTSRAHAPAPHAGEAGHRPFINLETVSTYEASGKCGSPVLLILCYPLAIVGGVVGAVLGCAVGAITGFVFAGIACNVADTLFSADVRSAALSIGGSIGGAVGLGIGVFVAGDFARRCSENRNAAVSLCFGVAGTAGLAIIYGVAWYSSAELATLGAWRALALIVILAAGAFATAVLTDRVTSVPYCESCHSCCDKSIAKHFTEKASTIRSNARTGDVQALSALQAVDEAAANAAVVCATCREGCMGYSQIGQAVMVKMEPSSTTTDDIPLVAQTEQGIRETAKAEGAEWAQDKFEKQFQVVHSGAADCSAATLWREVLSGRSEARVRSRCVLTLNELRRKPWLKVTSGWVHESFSVFLGGQRLRYGTLTCPFYGGKAVC